MMQWKMDPKQITATTNRSKKVKTLKVQGPMGTIQVYSFSRLASMPETTMKLAALILHLLRKMIQVHRRKEMGFKQGPIHGHILIKI